MGVFEEAKIRVQDLQKRVQRIDEAGQALSKNKNDKTAKSKFKVMYATLERMYEDFETQLGILIKHNGKPGTEDVVPNLDGLRAEFEEQYFSCKILADEFLPESSMANSEESRLSNSSRASNASVVPLEKLTIAKFSGDPKAYTGFRNLFDTIVHENTNIRPVVKFGYLKSYLEGEPLKLIANLMLTDSNYELALSQLEARYANRRYIAESHLDELFDAPNATVGNGNSIVQLLNTITSAIGALENLKYPVDQWSPILLHQLQKKLDHQLRAQWELAVDTTTDPTLAEFVTFLTKFSKSAIVSQGKADGGQPKHKWIKPNRTMALFSGAPSKEVSSPSNRPQKKTFKCQVCEAEPGHLLIHCTRFKKMTPKQRHQTIKDLKRCFMCFSEHLAPQCKSDRVCVECSGRHHTWLHLSTRNDSASEDGHTIEPEVRVHVSADIRNYRTSVLLSTASVSVQDSDGQFRSVRALLDSASQSSFITEHCFKSLGLSRRKSNVTIQALAGTPVPTVRGFTQVLVRPNEQTSPTLTVEVLILPRITGLTPSARIWKNDWPHIADITLADPAYHESLPIDILFGADVFPYLLCGDKREGGLNEPVALSTIFGWILMGRIAGTEERTTNALYTTLESIDQSVQRFWELEEVPTAERNTPADMKCEEIYTSTTSRQDDGRYIVHLPFVTNPPKLGESRATALKRLHRLETRLEKSEDLRTQYNAAMQDYLDSGHMTKVPQAQCGVEPVYYTPHHAVIKLESTTTKVRVVYDASAVTTSGMSLNDNLYPGPKLQQDLPGIVLRFRLHTIVFTADVKQMFRQIKVTPEHHQYQRLLYRFSLAEPVSEFEMTTVSFGQRSSPFLAIRTLHQLVEDEAKQYPEVRQVVREDMYVDDVATGSDSVENGLELQRNLSLVMGKGQFELRKWSSNSRALLEAVPSSHRQTDPVTFDVTEGGTTNVLGLKWIPNLDKLSYNVRPNPVRYSKRAILSEIARIYDPLGLLSPVTTELKRLMKYLWSIDLGWDDNIPQEAAEAWTRYHQELPELSSIRVPRRVTSNNGKYELHGFSDSSEAAYAAVIYLRVVAPDNSAKCFMLMGKSKVAPSKRITIPRLELCGALLLARLLHFVCQNLTRIKIERVIAWSDSTVALAWIKSPTAQLKTFVANRVAQIQRTTTSYLWRHVPTKENPADCASRGLSPKELANHVQWWMGPTFLRLSEDYWPSTEAVMLTDESREEQLETKVITLVTTETLTECPLLYQSDSWTKITRLACYWLRVRKRLLKKEIPDRQTPPTSAEVDEAIRALVQWTQRVYFSDDLNNLTHNRSGSSKLRKLAPFLDFDNVIRVGGRLQRADLPFDQKCPILLPKEARMTTLLIDQVHRSNGHPGAQTVQNIIRQHFWVLSARGVIRKQLHRCIPCFRVLPRAPQPIMGDLPPHRLGQIKPFGKVGIDFAGPFDVKAALLRRLRVTKAYICIFVCMATTAVHIELASDLSTPTFIAALERFIARRGRCTDIYTDCGTNFVGANHYLKEVQEILKSPTTIRYASSNQVTWHFNPPAAPHMGGLWEAAVKSAKGLLRRIVHDQVLTYEELNTVLHKIEATLNSRPLGALSSDPNDLAPLTAGHFLTMGPPASIPQPYTHDHPLAYTLRQRWTLVQQIQLHFWQRWQKEYLQNLQTRKKWQRPDRNLAVDDLVIIKEPTPPLTWSTARVVKLYPGEDNVVRVADVKLANGKTLKRPVVKLCPLPL
ncbi:unnamed protein product [Macrosiphum euphorbiae]|uniref:Integrase catalytic domain-containing protein n=1 Tax=Macrosiphum euphorbiae TaxID=13131 RepID=A0AAV0W2Z0_9HEMI|nr:unnamed protein product [Macrosiphum euphorbiae]